MKQEIILCTLIPISTVWIFIMASASSLTNQEALEDEADQVTKSAGYPKPGDIPVLNRKVFRLPTDFDFSVPIQELNVVLGENYSDRGSKLYTIVMVIIHEEFEPYTLKNDIAMLRIYENVKYKGNVKRIALPIKESLSGAKAFVTGWGRCDNMGTELCLDRTSKYYPDEKIDPMLRTVTFTMNFSNNYYCEGYKRHEVTVFPGMLCTGVARVEDQDGPCLGAPGALLVAGARLAGLLSWGFGCGYSYDLPLVYTSTQYFHSWITHNIKMSRFISQNNLTDIFLATKAAVLSQWLIKTRIITPKLHIRMDKSLEPLSIDQEIVKLRGSIYDVRDYIANGVFHQKKTAMYEDLRTVHSTILLPTRVTPILAPFIGNETLLEIGFNIDNIVSDAASSTESSDQKVLYEM